MTTANRLWWSASRRRSALRVASVLGLCATMSACTDFDSVSSGDGGSGAPSTSNGSDAGAVDGAQQDGGGATKGFCTSLSPAPTFCDDFDGDSIDKLWEGTESTNGVIANDTLAFLSPPASLSSKSSAIPSGQGVRSVAKKAFTLFTGARVAIRVSFDMNVEQFDATSGGLIIAFALLFGVDGDFDQIVLNLASTGSSVVAQVAENEQSADGGTGYALHGPFSKRPKINDWSKVRIEVDIQNTTGTGNSLRVYIDDVAQYDGSLQLPLKSGTPRMELGVGWAQAPAKAWSVRYDNFTADLHTLQ